MRAAHKYDACKLLERMQRLATAQLDHPGATVNNALVWAKLACDLDIKQLLDKCKQALLKDLGALAASPGLAELPTQLLVPLLQNLAKRCEKFSEYLATDGYGLTVRQFMQ